MVALFLIVRRLNLKVATKKLLHQQIKTVHGTVSANVMHGSVSLQIFMVVSVHISEVPECHFVLTDEFSVRVTKITLRIGVS